MGVSGMRCCCVPFDRQCSEALVHSIVFATEIGLPVRQHIVNFSSVSALASSPSILCPSVKYLHQLMSYRNHRCGLDVYGLLYGNIVAWENAEPVPPASLMAVKVQFREPSGQSMWFDVDLDCVVASSVVTLTPQFRISSNCREQCFCIVVSKIVFPSKRMSESGVPPGEGKQCLHRIDIIADINPSGVAWVFAHNSRRNINCSNSSCSYDKR